MNHIIEELFKYSNDLIQDERKKIDVNLNAFEKFIRFRVESDLKNFPLAKTKIVYEKIYERATGGLKGEYPFGTRNIIHRNWGSGFTTSQNIKRK